MCASEIVRNDSENYGAFKMWFNKTIVYKISLGYLPSDSTALNSAVFESKEVTYITVIL